MYCVVEAGWTCNGHGYNNWMGFESGLFKSISYLLHEFFRLKLLSRARYQFPNIRKFSFFLIFILFNYYKICELNIKIEISVMTFIQNLLVILKLSFLKIVNMEEIIQIFTRISKNSTFLSIPDKILKVSLGQVLKENLNLEIVENNEFNFSPRQFYVSNNSYKIES